MKFQNPILKTFILEPLPRAIAVQSGTQKETNGKIKNEICQRGDIYKEHNYKG